MDNDVRGVAAPTTHAASGTSAATHESRPRRTLELLVIVVSAVAIAILLRTFVVASYSIPSGSMEPTLQIGDRILVDKLSYDLHGVGHADIVVFATPRDEYCAGPPVANLVKRVIGLPGETISLSAGQVYIDGTLLSEPWLPAATRMETFPGPSANPFGLTRPYKIPAGDVYVMGDNRTDSCDSRFWGPIAESTIVGKVDLRIWPHSKLHLF